MMRQIAIQMVIAIELRKSRKNPQEELPIQGRRLAAQLRRADQTKRESVKMAAAKHEKIDSTSCRILLRAGWVVTTHLRNNRTPFPRKG
jgi:hypothetical protein